MFNVEFGIDLKKFIVIIDQGSALKAIYDKFKEHIACLRHFLVSLKSHPFSYQVGQIISCRCTKDLDALLTEYAKSFVKITDDSTKKTIDKNSRKNWNDIRKWCFIH